MTGHEYCRQINVHIGQRIKTRRKQERLSQSELGGHVELTFQQIQKYEHGTNRIGAALLFAIAQNLHVPINYFFDGVVATPATTQEYDNIELLHLFQSLPMSMREHLLAILQMLTKA